jgi:hypothetical protein
MKTSLLRANLLFLAAGCILMLSTSSCHPKHECYKNPLPGEDTLCLTKDTMQVSTANNLFAMMDGSIYTLSAIGNYTPIDTLDDKVDTGNFRKLYDIAYHLGTGTAEKRFVTVLEIQYGLNSGKIKLYYKPMCLAWNSSSSSGGETYGTYSNYHSFDSNYFEHIASGFVRVGYKLQFQPDSASYVTNIRIRHHMSDPTPGMFNWATDSTGDVRAITYDFQEIYALIKDNHRSDVVKISNIAQPLTVVSTGASPFIKESVIMGPGNLLPGGHGPGGGGTGVFHDVYADLAGMCPPDCPGGGGSIKYQIAR